MRKSLFPRRILWIVFLVGGILLGACSKHEEPLTKIPSSTNFLVATNEPLDDEEIGQQIGVIEKRVKSNKELVEWSSKNLQEGTKIYEIKGREDSEIKYYAYEKEGQHFVLSPYFENK